MTSEDLIQWIGCDQCGSAKAMYLTKLMDGELAFCGHHFNLNKEALDKVTIEIIELDKVEEVPQLEKKKTKELEKEIARCNNIQMARKIQLNSAYGAIGNQYFRYFKLANAEAITLSGQVSIQWIMNKMNSYLNKILKTGDVDYVIASDTDSLYINMGPLVESVFKGREKTTQSIVSFLDYRDWETDRKSTRLNSSHRL